MECFRAEDSRVDAPLETILIAFRVRCLVCIVQIALNTVHQVREVPHPVDGKPRIELISLFLFRRGIDIVAVDDLLRERDGQLVWDDSSDSLVIVAKRGSGGSIEEQKTCHQQGTTNGFASREHECGVLGGGFTKE